ncbi:hypothetical protein RFI_03217, partial [Reticulomyxa filosa]
YKYKLVGVTVHTGSAEAGHYYSYIKDRKTGDWNEFNDSWIKPFDPKDMDKECFGGKKPGNSSNSWSSDWGDNQERIKNGYILVYERPAFLKPEHNVVPTTTTTTATATTTTRTEEKKQEPTQKKQDEGDNKDASLEEAKMQDKGKTKSGNNLGVRVDPGLSVDESSLNFINREKKKEEKKEEEEKKEALVNVLDFTDIDPVKIMAQEIKTDIVNNNIEFMRDRQVFNPAYFKFVFDVVRVAPVPPFKEYDDTGKENIGLSVIQLATKVCFQYIARTADKQVIFNKFVAYLKWLFENNVPACKWLLYSLSEKRKLVSDYMLKTREVPVMRGFGELLVHAFKTLKPFEEQSLDKVETITRTVKTKKGEDKKVEEEVGVTATTRMVETLIALIELAPKYWFRFSYFFNVFRDFAILGPLQRTLLVRRHLIEKLGDLYLGNRSPYAKDTPNKQYQQMGSRMYPPKFDSLVQTLSLLICSCHTPSTRTRLTAIRQQKELTDNERKELIKFPQTSILYKNANNEDDLLEMSSKDEKLPHAKEFYLEMISQAHRSKDILHALSDIMCHWSFEDAKYSDDVVRIIIDGIDSSGPEFVITYLHIMEHFIGINDSYQNHRLEQLHGKDVGVLSAITTYRLHHQPFSFTCMRHVIEIMLKNETYRNFMLQKRNEWKWWDSWLDSYINRRYGSTSDVSPDKKKLFDAYLQLLTSNNIEPIRNVQREEPKHLGGEGGYSMYDTRVPSSFPEDHEPGQTDDIYESDEEAPTRLNAGQQGVTGPQGHGTRHQGDALEAVQSSEHPLAREEVPEHGPAGNGKNKDCKKMFKFLRNIVSHTLSMYVHIRYAHTNNLDGETDANLDDV